MVDLRFSRPTDFYTSQSSVEILHYIRMRGITFCKLYVVAISKTNNFKRVTTVYKKYFSMPWSHFLLFHASHVSREIKEWEIFKFYWLGARFNFRNKRVNNFSVTSKFWFNVVWTTALVFYTWYSTLRLELFHNFK